MLLHGNAVVGQSGGPTAAINATLSGVIKGALEAKKEGIVGTLYGMKNGIEGFLKENLVDLFEIFSDVNDLKTLEATPAAALGSCRRKLKSHEDDAETYARILEILKKYDIRYFFYIGGNDSMDTVLKLSRYAAAHDYELRVVGVPKTIDNDLMATDHTPGFGSAAKFVATTVSEIVRDINVYTMDAVTIVEIMGRDAGWLTASAALASLGGEGPDLIYLPERVFDEDSFVNDVKERLKDHPAILVAVSEGIRFANGVNNTNSVGDYCVLPGTEMTKVGAGVEYYPLGNNRNIRFHANCSYAWGKNTNENGTVVPEQTLFDVGVKWKVDILSITNKIFK